MSEIAGLLLGYPKQQDNLYTLDGNCTWWSYPKILKSFSRKKKRCEILNLTQPPLGISVVLLKIQLLFSTKHEDSISILPTGTLINNKNIRSKEI